MTKRVEAEAFAKINLSLDVLGCRPDGYHEVEMVMQSVGLADRLSFQRNSQLEAASALGSPAVSLETGGFPVPPGADNIIHRAAAAFSSTFGVQVGVSIRVDKGIPVAAGLAGGSADAAATLLALARLYRPDLGPGELIPAGVTVGADVAFCLVGGTCLAQGLGDIVTPLESPAGLVITLCKPDFGVSTADVYRWFDQLEIERIARPRTDRLIQALKTGDLKAVGGLLANVLESATMPHHPQLADLKEEMRSCGFQGVLMSGSGPTLFGVAEDPGPGERLSRSLIGRAGVRVWPNLSAAAQGVTLREVED